VLRTTSTRVALPLGAATAAATGEAAAGFSNSASRDSAGAVSSTSVTVPEFARLLLEGDGFEPSVPPREKPTSSPVGTRSPEPPRGGDGNGQSSVRTATSAMAPSGNRPICDQPFGGCACRRAGSAGGRSRPCSPNIPRCARSSCLRSSCSVLEICNECLLGTHCYSRLYWLEWIYPAVVH
jgi:hypothetical protein